jgi:NAD(P)-dependent dehydrogenase (short-subunit alcohol dehydrogenase family)
VREFVSRWEAEKRELHILVNNAGIYSMGGEGGGGQSKRLSAEMHEMQ